MANEIRLNELESRVRYLEQELATVIAERNKAEASCVRLWEQIHGSQEEANNGH